MVLAKTSNVLVNDKQKLKKEKGSVFFVIALVNKKVRVSQLFPNQLFSCSFFAFGFLQPKWPKMGHTTRKSRDLKAWDFLLKKIQPPPPPLLCTLGRWAETLEKKRQKVTNLCESARRRSQDLHRRGLVGFPGVPKNITVPTTDSSQNRGWRVGFGGIECVVRLFERQHPLRCVAQAEKLSPLGRNINHMKKITSLHLCRHSMQGCRFNHFWAHMN